MGSTAEERREKRRINELEEELKAMQRKMQSLKARNKKQVGRLRKEVKRTEDLQEDLSDLHEQELAKQKSAELKNKYRKEQEELHPHLKCRKSGCWSKEVTTIAAGIRTVVVCTACEGRYTIATTELKNAG